MKFIGVSFVVGMMSYFGSAVAETPSLITENPVTILSHSLVQTQKSFVRLGHAYDLDVSHHGAQLQGMPECSIALQELSFVVGRCSATYQAMFDTTGTFSQGDLSTYCNGSCVNDTKAVIENASTLCKGLIQLDRLNDFNEAIQGMQLVCARQGETYCWSKVTSLMTIVPGSSSRQQLNQICDSCTETLGKMAARIGSSQLSKSLQFLAPYCTKINDEYCGAAFYLAKDKFQDIMNPSELSLSSSLQAICHPCVASYLQKMNQVYLTTNTTSELNKITLFVDYMGVVCDKKPSGEYCLPEILSKQGDFLPCQTRPTGSDSAPFMSCSTECSSALTRLSSSLGCCFGTAIRFLSFDVKPKGAIKRFVTETCGVKGVHDCSAKIMKATLMIKNMLWSYVVNNMDKVKDAIALDLSAATGVTPDRVKIDAITQSIASQTSLYQLMSSTQIKVTASLIPASTSDADSILSTMTSSLQQDGIRLDSVSQLGLESREDPLQDVAINTVDSRVEATVNPDGPVATSSAMGVNAGSGLLYALLSLVLVTSYWM